MANKTTRQEPDSVYFLKLLLYLILGLLWIKRDGRTIIPIGLILGLLFAHHDHFRIDRKIEYAVLLIAALLAFAGFGIFINLQF
ncbi:MAG TPA: hypothetical protein VK963_01215 [Candidatus Saccharimonadales bacterium]|nr:hypothetical protein [Candidatus Saccharimonadales bacterium]